MGAFVSKASDLAHLFAAYSQLANKEQHLCQGAIGSQITC